MGALQLNDHEIDVLKETLNIGAGSAAKVLSDMLGGRAVGLGIPTVQLLNSENLEKALITRKATALVSLGFTGFIEGQAQINFTELGATSLIRTMVDEIVRDEEVEAMREEVLNEVSNVVINGVMGAIANLTQQNFNFGLPKFQEISEDHQSLKLDSEATYIVADIHFDLEKTGQVSDMQLVFLTSELDKLFETLLEYFKV